jgi:hypothetical protein
MKTAAFQTQTLQALPHKDLAAASSGMKDLAAASSGMKYLAAAF